LVLNNANAYGAGGGCKTGCTAQEEDMMRCGNYYPGILKVDGQNSTDKDGLYKKPITQALTSNCGAILTKDITAWRDDYQFNPLEKRFQYNALAMAAPNLSYKQYIEKTPFWNTANKCINYNAYAGHMELLIRSQLYIAIGSGATVFLPGAIGCGVFKSYEEGTTVNGQLIPIGHTATIVANIYKKLLITEGLAKHFDEVRFPIYNGWQPHPDTSNLAIFQRVFGLDPALQIHTGSQAHYTALQSHSVEAVKPK